MNAMTEEQRKAATDAALAELLTEMDNWDVDVGPNGMSIEAYINEAHKANEDQISDKNQRILEIFAAKLDSDQDFKRIQIVDIDKRNGAVTSYNPDTNTYTVSFCGTRAEYAEWEDNAIGLSEGSSLAQRNAAAYFDLISSKFGNNANVIVSGHSKGGNKAMYVTMFSQNRDKIDQCYALDGQSFAKNDVTKMKTHSDYDQQRSKIVLIAGENDYVSQLGERIISDEQIFYVRDSHRAGNEGLMDAFQNDHSVQYMFFDSDLAYETKQGPLGGVIRELYETLSDKLSEGEFHMVCRVLMNVMDGNLNKEELLIVIGIIAPHVSDVLYNTEAGQSFFEYLPVTLVSNEEMQNGAGKLAMILTWYLSLSSDSRIVQAFQAVFKVVTGADFVTVDMILETYAKAIKVYIAVKDYLYVKFRVGADSRYHKTADLYAAQSGYMKYNTDEIKLAAERLNTAAENIDYICNGFNFAFYLEKESKESLESGILNAWESGKKHLNNSSQKLRQVSTALSEIAEKLENAEVTAEKYGRM